MNDKEKIEIIDRFLLEIGAWDKFVAWLKDQGYRPEELGFPKEDES